MTLAYPGRSGQSGAFCVGGTIVDMRTLAAPIRTLAFWLSLVVATASPAIADDPVTLAGSIDSHYGLEMTLEREGSVLHGSYVSAGVGKVQTVSGTIDGENMVTLNASNDAGTPTGVFRGHMTVDTGFIGTFANLDGTVVLPFVAIQPAAMATAEAVVITQVRETFKTGTPGTDSYHEGFVSYPLVAGADKFDVLRQVQATIDLKTVTGLSMDERRADFPTFPWVAEMGYVVHYNNHGILDLTFTQVGSGMFSDVFINHLILDLRTGAILTASDVFDPAALAAILPLVEAKWRADMEGATATAAGYELDIRDQFTGRVLTLKNLDDFSISDQGVTFLYDFMFPHGIAEAAPSGRYFLSYQGLQPYIRQDGPLAVFVS